MIRDSLAELVELLEIAVSNAERAEAIALWLATAESTFEFARFVRQRAHLIVRGGARTLLREMLSTITASHREISVFADIAETYLAEQPRDFGVRFSRVASTRSLATRRRITIETDGYEVGGLHFSPDRKRIYAFIDGEASIAQWDVSTGRPLGAVRAGQFREGNGAMGINSSLTRAVVRSHRDMVVHAIDAAGQVEARPHARIHLDEGPSNIAFIDEHTLLANNAFDILVAGTEDGGVTRLESSVGRVFAYSPKHARVFVGGTNVAGAAFAIHDFASLAITGQIASSAPKGDDRGRGRIETMALSPSEETIVTGDWSNEVRLWSVRQILRAGEGASKPVPVSSVPLGKHRGWVSVSAFLSEQRLLTGAWDGALIEWDLENREAIAHAYEHHGYITALALDGERRAATGASDGQIVIWDLDAAADEATPPPFIISHGSHSLPLTMELRGEESRIALGTTEAFFGPNGQLLRSGTCVTPPEYRGAPQRYEAIRGFMSGAIELDLTAEGSQIAVSRDGENVDVLELDAPARGFMWIDAHSIIVLDAVGHVELWSVR